MKKLLLSFAVAMVAVVAMAFEAPDNGYWLVIFDQYGEEYAYQLNEGTDGSYTTTITLNYFPWGEFYWDPNLSDAANEANRPAVPYYFVVDGVRLGAVEDMQATEMGEAAHTEMNPLVESEFMYTVPVGYSYTLGVFIANPGTELEEKYVYCAQGFKTGVDEVDATKAVASVRYFNMAGQEMQQANGMTIVVTTYTDGTTSAAKVMK